MLTNHNCRVDRNNSRFYLLNDSCLTFFMIYVHWERKNSSRLASTHIPSCSFTFPLLNLLFFRFKSISFDSIISKHIALKEDTCMFCDKGEFVRKEERFEHDWNLIWNQIWKLSKWYKALEKPLFISTWFSSSCILGCSFRLHFNLLC